MTIDQILSLGPALADFVDQFSDCFGRSEPRNHLANYIRGQLSSLPRKSVEPIAAFVGVAPRTLQEFLGTDEWDHEKLRDRLQQIVARDHADPQAIGIIDDSGHPKKGNKTACVSRQYCGNTGKIDNCVVTVHLSFASYDARFRTMLDSTLYLPKDGWDEARRREARIPEDVVYRPKYVIALEQLDRALANGVRLGWITADEWYANFSVFVEGLEERKQRFVLEIPLDPLGWLFFPGDLRVPPKRVDNLGRYSRPLAWQPWTRFHVKDTEKGPLVWEVKASPFWMWMAGKVRGPYWLVMARNVLDPKEQKYFLSNAAPGTPLEAILHVAFSRWPIERCFEDEKTELGLSHFEVRGYPSILRHLLITQVSHLFLAQQNCRLRGEKSGGHHLPGAYRSRRVDRRPAAFAQRPARASGEGGQRVATHAGQKHPRPSVPHQDPNSPTAKTQDHPRRTTLLYPTVNDQSAL